MLAETLVIQHSRCYSVVSSSLKNPLPDCSNYSPFSLIHYLTLRPDQYCTSLFGPDPLPSRSAGEYSHWLLQRFTVKCESSRELMSAEGVLLCLEEAEQQAEASGDVPPPPLQIVISILFCLFLFFLISLFTLPSFFPIFLAYPFFLFWSIICPPKIKTSTFIQLI